MDIIAQEMQPGTPPETTRHDTFWMSTLGLKAKGLAALLRTCRDLRLLYTKSTRNVLTIGSYNLLSQKNLYQRNVQGSCEALTTQGSPGSRVPVSGSSSDPAIKRLRSEATKVFNARPGWSFNDVAEIVQQLPSELGEKDLVGGMLVYALETEGAPPPPGSRSRPAEKIFVGLIGTKRYAVADSAVARFKTLRDRSQNLFVPRPSPLAEASAEKDRQKTALFFAQREKRKSAKANKA
jgi:hypothetical protein